MWFPTAEKVDRELGDLIRHFEALRPRIDDWLKRAELGASSGIPSEELVAMLNEANRVQYKLHADLLEARLGIQMGGIRWKQAIPLLKACKSVAKTIEWHLDKMDIDARSGRTNIRELLGDGTAQN